MPEAARSKHKYTNTAWRHDSRNDTYNRQRGQAGRDSSGVESEKFIRSFVYFAYATLTSFASLTAFCCRLIYLIAI